MIKVIVNKQSNHLFGVVKVKRALKEVIRENGVTSNTIVGVTIVGEKKMLELGKTYLGEKSTKPHNVLSFTEGETPTQFVYPPGDTIRLGEIVVCYPVAIKEATRDNMLIDDKIIELVNHGVLHLLGIHHD